MVDAEPRALVTGVGVAVAVAVGGREVAVGGTGVFVGGMGVALGGSGVSVAGTDVAAAGGDVSAGVAVGEGCSASVGVSNGWALATTIPRTKIST